MTDYQFFEPQILVRALKNIGVSIDAKSASRLNHEEVAKLLSGGLIENSKKKFSVFALLKLMLIHFKVERFILRAEAIEESEFEKFTSEEKKIMSVTLGFCIQALMSRLPHHGDEDLAGWLMKKDALSPRLAMPIRKIEKIQVLRTKLSGVWGDVFLDEKKEGASQVDAKTWKGLGVYPGKFSGEAILIKDLKAVVKSEVDGKILIFKNASPKTVDFFQNATAVLFCEGGLLSHACVMAREYQKPSITALGSSFLANAEASQKLHLEIDCESGTVVII